MIGAHDVGMNCGILHPVGNIPADEEVVNPPADVSVTSAGQHVPPGVLAGFLIENSEGVDESSGKESVHPSPLFREKAGDFDVLSWTSEVDL